MDITEAMTTIAIMLADNHDLAKEGNAYLDDKQRNAVHTAWKALYGLKQLYETHQLERVSPDSAADQCSTLYELLGELGLEVD